MGIEEKIGTDFVDSLKDEFSDKLKKIGYKLQSIGYPQENVINIGLESNSWLKKIRFIETYFNITGSDKKQEKAINLFKDGFNYQDVNYDVNIRFVKYSRFL